MTSINIKACNHKIVWSQYVDGLYWYTKEYEDQSASVGINIEAHVHM